MELIINEIMQALEINNIQYLYIVVAIVLAVILIIKRR